MNDVWKLIFLCSIVSGFVGWLVGLIMGSNMSTKVWRQALDDYHRQVMRGIRV